MSNVQPENLMLTKDGHLKLIDFGTAKKMNAGSNEKGPMDRRSTFVGTAYYVAPELIEESECSAPADLWALGKWVLLECCYISDRVHNFPHDDWKNAVC